MFSHMTFDSIIADMLNNVPSNVDKREGSVIYDSLAPVAIELAQMYINLDVILLETFGDTSSRDFLIRRALERGITPFQATYAIWLGEFDFPVPIGSRFSLNDLNFIVTQAISDTNFILQCETLGSIGNKTYGTLIPIEYISGLSVAKLTELLIPASDDEDTEVFRSRYLNSFSSQSFGGNISDYLEKTMEIDGVGALKVTPVWNGGGTVKLTILDALLSPANQILLDKVQDIMDPDISGEGLGLAPIGHKVTVDTVEVIAVFISSNFVFDTGYSFDILKNSIVNSVNLYFDELKQDWADSSNLVLRIAQIETRILSVNGVLDVSNTKINDDLQNLILTTNQLAILSDIVEVFADD